MRYLVSLLALALLDGRVLLLGQRLLSGLLGGFLSLLPIDRVHLVVQIVLGRFRTVGSHVSGLVATKALLGGNSIYFGYW